MSSPFHEISLRHKKAEGILMDPDEVFFLLSMLLL
jgi:hypothetical protein